MVHPKCKLRAEQTSILVSDISGGGGGGDSKSKGQHEGSRSASSEARN